MKTNTVWLRIGTLATVMAAAALLSAGCATWEAMTTPDPNSPYNKNAGLNAINAIRPFRFY